MTAGLGGGFCWQETGPHSRSRARPVIIKVPRSESFAASQPRTVLFVQGKKERTLSIQAVHSSVAATSSGEWRLAEVHRQRGYGRDTRLAAEIGGTNP
jgi:hypothetical protein